MGVRALVTQVLSRGNYSYLSRVSGLDRTHITRVLNGDDRGLSLSAAARLSDAAGVSLDTLWRHIQRSRRRRLLA